MSRGCWWNDKVEVVGKSPHRKVIAKQPLQRGEIVLKEHPVSYVLHPPRWTERCHCCFRKAPKLLRCSRCRQCYYCSRDCQRTDWRQHHSVECKALSRMPHLPNSYDLLADALLVARVIRRKESSPQDYQAIHDLLFHTESLAGGQETRQRYDAIVTFVRSMGLLQQNTNSTTDQEMLELLARFDCNNFGLVDDLLFVVGTGIYPAGAALNHSCNHNCAIAYEFWNHPAKSHQQPVQVIRCIVDDVQAGDELCHPYLDFANLTSSQRRDKLQNTYHFQCHCQRCLDVDGTWAKIDDMLTGTTNTTTKANAEQVIRDTERLLQQAALADDIHQEMRLLQECVQARAAVLHPRHVAVYAARSQLHTTAMAAGDYEVAKQQCTELVHTMRQCYYKPQHPLVGIMTYTLASLHHSLQEYDKAIQCYQQALPVLQSYHGPDHSVVVGCRDYLEQAQQEQTTTR